MRRRMRGCAVSRRTAPGTERAAMGSEEAVEGLSSSWLVVISTLVMLCVSSGSIFSRFRLEASTQAKREKRRASQTTIRMRVTANCIRSGSSRCRLARFLRARGVPARDSEKSNVEDEAGTIRGDCDQSQADQCAVRLEKAVAVTLRKIDLTRTRHALSCRVPEALRRRTDSTRGT